MWISLCNITDSHEGRMFVTPAKKSVSIDKLRNMDRIELQLGCSKLPLHISIADLIYCNCPVRRERKIERKRARGRERGNSVIISPLCRTISVEITHKSYNFNQSPSSL